MFFRSKRKNRRLTRAYVLDVKLNATQRRQSRLRRLWWFCGSTLILTATAWLGWRGGELTVRRFVYQNPTFAIRGLQIETDGVLSTEQIRSWAGVKVNDNLLALDLARVERDLKLVPAIESVIVERALPSVLRIRITEREPLAQVAFAEPPASLVSNRFTLDGNGYFMFPIEASQRAIPVDSGNEHLPLLTGIPTRDIRPGRQAESPQVRAALQLVQAFRGSAMAGVVDLKQIAVGTPGSLLITTAQGNEVTFGLHDFPAQLRRWRLVHDHAQRFGKHLLTLDLAVANHSPLQWADVTSVTPPPAPKPLKASPYRKKHV